MTLDQAKQISIKDYLASIGHYPVKEMPKSWLYYSPIHTEKTPSFHVMKDGKFYKDFGLDDKAGDIVNLVQKIHGLSIKAAFEKLQSTQIQASNFSFYEKQTITNKRDGFSTRPITKIDLINYLAYRKIPKEIWSKQANLFQACYYIIDAKKINLAWKNDSGGFDLRGTGQKRFVSTEGIKDITTIPGGTDINVFEGFFDYMSALTYFKTWKLKNTSVVLNSLSNIQKASKLFVPGININLFLDNDQAGHSATSQLIKVYSNCVDRSKQLYPDHKDFNDFLINLSTK